MSTRLTIDYREVKTTKGGKVIANRSLWYSKTVAQHGIDTVRVAASKPCADSRQTSTSSLQSFYFAEMAKEVAGCSQ